MLSVAVETWVGLVMLGENGGVGGGLVSLVELG